MNASALLLSRLQFAWVIAWHILLPAFTIGLASYIAVLELLYFLRRREIYLSLATFWTKIFAVSFGMGVVSGIVLPFQFGTNWSAFSYATANVLSPLFAYEDLTAFFLEAAFLGVLLFGRKLVPAWAHLFAAVMVAAGTLFSAFWILAANSWMQTPAGFAFVNGRFYPTNWLEIIFNPSFPYRLTHMVVACYITTAFVVLGVAAYYLRRDRYSAQARLMISMALGLLTVLVPAQMLIGDAQGRNTLKYQPAKLAAIEAHWHTAAHVPLILFALPDEHTATNHDAISVPDLGSLILTHSRDGVVRGLASWPRSDWPPVAIPFFAFRIMVGIALVMLTLVMAGWWLRLRGRLYEARGFLRLCELASPIGFFAVLAGWVTTEVGRQPWTVYGLLRTSQSVTPSLTGPDVAWSLAGYVGVYLILYPVGVRHILRMIRRGPAIEVTGPEPIESGRPQLPFQTLQGPHADDGDDALSPRRER